jgi:hypothetical protein
VKAFTFLNDLSSLSCQEGNIWANIGKSVAYSRSAVRHFVLRSLRWGERDKKQNKNMVE